MCFSGLYSVPKTFKIDGGKAVFQSPLKELTAFKFIPGFKEMGS